MGRNQIAEKVEEGMKLFPCWATNEDKLPCRTAWVLALGRRYCSAHSVILDKSKNPYVLMDKWDKERREAVSGLDI